MLGAGCETAMQCCKDGSLRPMIGSAVDLLGNEVVSDNSQGTDYEANDEKHAFGGAGLEIIRCSQCVGGVRKGVIYN